MLLHEENVNGHWDNMLDVAKSEESFKGDSDDEVVSSSNVSGEVSEDGDLEVNKVMNLSNKVGFVVEENEEVKGLLRDLNMAFGKNGGQVRKKKLVRRLAKEDESLSNEF